VLEKTKSLKSQPVCSADEERPEQRKIILVGTKRDGINAFPPEQSFAFDPFLLGEFAELGSYAPIGKIDLVNRATLRIFNSDDADIRQRMFAPIFDWNRNQVMSAA
jgi:hypothetical protein